MVLSEECCSYCRVPTKDGCPCDTFWKAYFAALLIFMVLLVTATVIFALAQVFG